MGWCDSPRRRRRQRRAHRRHRRRARRARGAVPVRGRHRKGKREKICQMLSRGKGTLDARYPRVFSARAHVPHFGLKRGREQSNAHVSGRDFTRLTSLTLDWRRARTDPRTGRTPTRPAPVRNSPRDLPCAPARATTARAETALTAAMLCASCVELLPLESSRVLETRLDSRVAHCRDAPGAMTVASTGKSRLTPSKGTKLQIDALSVPLRSSTRQLSFSVALTALPIGTRGPRGDESTINQRKAARTGEWLLLVPLRTGASQIG